MFPLGQAELLEIQATDSVADDGIIPWRTDIDHVVTHSVFLLFQPFLGMHSGRLYYFALSYHFTLSPFFQD